MKQVTEELRNYLHSRRHFLRCDLYELRLKSGLVFRYADYDMDIMTGGLAYSSKGPIFERSGISLSSSIEVDTMNVGVFVDAKDKIGDQQVMHIANNGGFDEATLTLLSCYMSDPGVVVDTVEMFTGEINVNDGGGLEMNWEVKSSVQRLNVEWPLHKYYPTCPYNLYDAGCGLNRADYLVAGTVTQVLAWNEFYTDLVAADGYFEQGGIEWLSGPLTGATAPIKEFYAVNGRTVMLIPLEASPTVGDMFRIYPGCNRLPVTCKDKFNNFLRNRATPYIPLKETII